MPVSVSHFATCLTFQPVGLLILLCCKLSSLPWIGCYSLSFLLSLLYHEYRTDSWGGGGHTRESGSSRGARWRVNSEAVWRVVEEQTKVDSVLPSELKGMALSPSVCPIKNVFLSSNRASGNAEKQTGFHIGPV